MSAPRVSIVVACRNEAPSIRAFLDNLLSQRTDGITWEALIADGMSEDSTQKVLSEYAARDSRIRLLLNPGQIVSTGLNAAIKAANGEIIVRMDVHTEYSPDYVNRCVEILERTDAENVGGPARTRATGLWPRAIAAAYHSRFACGGARFHDAEFEGYVDTVTYGCWLKTTLEHLGLFDEELVRNQDDELNLRLVRSGGKIYQSPSIVSWYQPRAKLRTLFKQYMQYGFWKVAVIRKHRIPASVRHLVPGAFVAAHLALAISLIVALIADSSLVTPITLIWAMFSAVYLSAAFAAALPIASRNGMKLFFLLPAVFATYHVSYGVGFLAGLYHFSGGRVSRAATGNAFAGLTR